LSDLAKRFGQTEDKCARELIEEHIDDLEDRYRAESRLKEQQPALTIQQVRNELGLER
jgi:predicted DNA-binding protein